MIRWIQPGDESAIIRLVRTQLVPISPRKGMQGSRLRRDITERLQRGATLVASENARSEPFAFLHMETRGGILFVDLLAVDAARQNRHLGTDLMRHAETFGRNQGCREARLFVDDNNVRGQRFYSKLGYTVVRHIPTARCYELFKPLSSVKWAF